MTEPDGRRRRLAAELPRVPLAALLDVAVVAVFVLLGRRTHEEGSSLAGWWHTAWPFLLALLVGWALVVLALGRLPLTLATGVPVWVSTVLCGMALRDLSGEGTALPFVVVATLSLALGLLGWRALLGRRLVAEQPLPRR